MPTPSNCLTCDDTGWVCENHPDQSRPLPSPFVGITVPAMAESMVLVLPFLTANCQVRRLRISVPLVPCLVDGQKYFRHGDLPPPEGLDLRSIALPKVTRAMVRFALASDDAEQRGRELKRRLDAFAPTQRRERARVLVDGGLNQSQAAVVLGVGKATVSRDLAERPCAAPSD